MVDDEQLEKALDWLRENANRAAKARADRLYCEEWLPALRATIAVECMAAGDSASAADMKAKASDAYKIALNGFKAAVEEDERMRWLRTRAESLVEIWRSGQANRRAMEKVT